MKKLINKFLRICGYKIISIKKRTSHPINQDNNYFNGKVSSLYEELPFAEEAMEYLIENFEFNTVLDIGSGEGKHSDLFKKIGKNVTSIDFGKSIYYNKRADNHISITGDYLNYEFLYKFDAIWASHVLEHQPNPNIFLRKVYSDLKEGGVLAVTVPPLKHEIVGGHLTLWNAGLLMYQLVLAGFCCKNASIKSYGYNVSIVLKKESIRDYPELSYDSGDIEKLKKYFPENLNEPFNGNIKELNWNQCLRET